MPRGTIRTVDMPCTLAVWMWSGDVRPAASQWHRAVPPRRRVHSDQYWCAPPLGAVTTVGSLGAAVGRYVGVVAGRAPSWVSR